MIHDVRRLLEGVNPRYFRVLPLEFCLQFLLLPVRLTDEEIHVLGSRSIPSHMLFHVQRITGRVPVLLPLPEDQEDRLTGTLSALLQDPEYLETSGRTRGELLALFGTPDPWGPDCWEALRSVNLALEECPHTEGWNPWSSTVRP